MTSVTLLQTDWATETVTWLWYSLGIVELLHAVVLNRQWVKAVLQCWNDKKGAGILVPDKRGWNNGAMKGAGILYYRGKRGGVSRCKDYTCLKVIDIWLTSKKVLA